MTKDGKFGAKVLVNVSVSSADALRDPFATLFVDLFSSQSDTEDVLMVAVFILTEAIKF